jgi:hypothetical protein
MPSLAFQPLLVLVPKAPSDCASQPVCCAELNITTSQRGVFAQTSTMHAPICTRYCTACAACRVILPLRIEGSVRSDKGLEGMNRGSGAGGETVLCCASLCVSAASDDTFRQAGNYEAAREVLSQLVIAIINCKHLQPFF